jgi:hypothetical protein
MSVMRQSCQSVQAEFIWTDSVPATSQVDQIRRTVEVSTESAGPISDTGQRAEGNGISQRVEWRNAVFPIRASFPGEDVDGARLQGA